MTQYFSRSAKALKLQEGPPKFVEVADFTAPDEPVRVAIYSEDGSRFAISTAKDTAIIDPDTGKVLVTIPQPAADMYFSPLGSYLVVWNRASKDKASGNWENNLKVYSTKSGEELGAFVQKTQGSYKGGWSVQWTIDEAYCIRQTTPKQLVVVPSAKIGDPAATLNTLDIPDGIAEFSVSQGKNPAVAVFILGSKGKPSSVRIYRLPNPTHPVAQRTLFKAENVLFVWNKLGTNLLVVAQTEDDQSGKSYYGESTLYLLSVNSGGDQRIMLDKEGPVHDVCWSPAGDEFGVVYGFMPSKTTFFDSRGNEVYSLPYASRNTLKYSPHGRYVIVAGFGNLQGVMDVYDRHESFAQTASITATNATFYDWSPDGHYILTATTAPRLRVDNCVRLWHVSGKLAYNQEFEELFTVGWRPQQIAFDASSTISVHDSAATVSVAKPQTSKGAYRPPHARGTGGSSATPALSLYQRSLLADKGPSPAATNNNRRPQRNGSPKGTNNKQPQQAQPQAQAEQTQGTNTTPEEKQIRSLVKKLRAIHDLKNRQAAGEKLEMTQVQKIDTEDQVVKKLESLGWKE